MPARARRRRNVDLATRRSTSRYAFPHGSAQRLDRPGRPGPPLHDHGHGPDGPQPCRTPSQLGAETDRHGAALDHRHLRLHAGRRAHPGRRPGRSDWPSQTAPGRRGGIRHGVGAGCLFDQRPHADRHPRAARPRRRRAGALNPVVAAHDVRGRRRANESHRRLGCELCRRRRHRAPGRRHSARTLLVGLRLPGRRTDHGVAHDRGPDPAARIPRRGRRSARPPERAAVDHRGVGGDLRPEADGPGWSELAALALDTGRRRSCRHFHPTPADAR